MQHLPFLTAPLSLLWGIAVRLRGLLFDCGLLRSERFEHLPVICVGNLSVGGTGKTPHVEFLLHILGREGLHVAMLSRGYGRKTKGFVLADADTTAREVGDEPLQIHRNCPSATVAVCEKRAEGIRRLMALPDAPQVIVLDDAFQHRYVRAGLNILLTDARRLYTNDHLLPWGRLREPASAARRADIIIITKCNGGERPVLPVAPHQSLFHSRIIYGTPYPFTSAGRPAAPAAAPAGHPYRGRRVLLIAGIANPRPLEEHLRRQGAAGVTTAEFRDHHDFTARDAERINRSWLTLAQQTEADAGGAVAVTTQKDAMRLTGITESLLPPLRSALMVQPITVSVMPAADNEPSFCKKIKDYVSQNSRNRRMD